MAVRQRSVTIKRQYGDGASPSRGPHTDTERKDAHHDHQELAAALYQVQLPQAIADPVDFTSAKNPAPGVAITAPVGIQWQKVPGSKYPLDAVVVDNTLQPNAKITGDLKPTYT